MGYVAIMATERLVHQILREVLQRRVTPGLAVAAAVLDSHGQVRAHQRWVLGTLGAHIPTAVSPDTVYDLASLTKVLSTTLLCAVAVTEGKLCLGETPWPWWPKVTVAHVLNHTAGLPARIDLWQKTEFTSLDANRRVLATLRGVMLQTNPGIRYLYSDLGFIALGLLLPKRLGATLPELFRRHAHKWYGSNGLYFAKVGGAKLRTLQAAVAPTGPSVLRGRIVHGEVNDDNACVLGGAAGHAGLFGGLPDVEQAARALLQALTNQGAPFDKKGVGKTLRRFAELGLCQHPLGFDIASARGSTAGWLSLASVGHLGFTGTSLWLDPVGRGTNGLPAYFILLSNAVHTGYHASRVLWMRQRVHWGLSLWARAQGLGASKAIKCPRLV